MGPVRATKLALDGALDAGRDVHGRSRKTDVGNPGEAQISLEALKGLTLQETPEEIVVQHQGHGELSSPDAVCTVFPGDVPPSGRPRAQGDGRVAQGDSRVDLPKSMPPVDTGDAGLGWEG